MESPQNKILAYLSKGGRLTVVKARELYHTTELRKIISRLRRKGYPISDKRCDTTTDDGRKTQFKEYYLA